MEEEEEGVGRLLPHLVPRSTSLPCEIRRERAEGARVNRRRSSVVLAAVAHEGNDEMSGDDEYGGNDVPTCMDISSMPQALQDKLAVFDLDKNGELDVAEMVKAAELYESLKNSKDCYHLNTFPSRMQKELVALDEDNDGTVSADEFTKVEWAVPRRL
jgi:hypothetical protein